MGTTNLDPKALSDLTPIEQIHLFLRFYFARWGATKGELWEWIVSESPVTLPINDTSVTYIVKGMLEGTCGFRNETVTAIRNFLGDEETS